MKVFVPYKGSENQLAAVLSDHFTNKLLKGLLPAKNTGQVGRLLKRLRVHRLIKRVGTRYKYYLTRLGMHIVSTALKLRELFVIPQLSRTP